MGTCKHAPDGWCDDASCITNGCKCAPSSKPRAMESALTELIRLRDLWNDSETINTSGSWEAVHRVHAMRDEYREKIGGAWDAARRAITMSPDETTEKPIGAQRFSIYVDDFDGVLKKHIVKHVADDQGKWVQSEDYEALRRRFEQACARITALESSAVETTGESHYCIDCNDAHDPRTCGALGPVKASECVCTKRDGKIVTYRQWCPEHGSEKVSGNCPTGDWPCEMAKQTTTTGTQPGHCIYCGHAQNGKGPHGD